MMDLNALRDCGFKVEEGLARCLNNEAFYLRLVGLMLDGDSLDKLEAAVEAGDLDAAFEAAHALKGVAGNLAAEPIFAPASEMTELLRSRAPVEYGPYVEQLRAVWDKLKALR